MTKQSISALLAAALAAIPALAQAPATVVPESLEVTVAVKATLDPFTVTVTDGRLTVATDHAAGTVSAASYGFEWKNANTGSEKRDREMREWVGADEHPGGMFTLTSFTDKDGGHVATGTLELRGTAREISFPVSVEKTDGGTRFSAEVMIDHREWGLKQFRKFGILSVNPKVTVRFKFETRNPA